MRGLAPYKIVNRGIARTFQLTRPFVGMTVLENVRGGLHVAARAARRTDKEERAHAICSLRSGSAAEASEPVETLPYGDLRRLEIARALATKPDLLLLDEPFAGLGSSEIEPLAQLIKRLHREEKPHHPADRAQAARIHGAGVARHRDRISARSSRSRRPRRS